MLFLFSTTRQQLIKTIAYFVYKCIIVPQLMDSKFLIYGFTAKNNFLQRKITKIDYCFIAANQNNIFIVLPTYSETCLNT